MSLIAFLLESLQNTSTWNRGRWEQSFSWTLLEQICSVRVHELINKYSLPWEEIALCMKVSGQSSDGCTRKEQLIKGGR